MTSTTFSIPDMHCSACVMRLEALEDDLEGVKSATGSYHRQQLIVDYDEKRVTKEQIMEAITRLGYHPVVR